jgi:DNA-binding MltR family transcriptional regulator
MNPENKKGYLKPPVNPHHEPYVDGLNSMLESLQEHDDRSMVLNMAAFAEDTLELLLLAYLREAKQAKELVNGFNAPLGTFSSRIKAAYVLGLLQKDSYETLEILRKIRNKFAHNWEGVSLDREDIEGLIAQLSRSRIETLAEAQSEDYNATARARLNHKISDVLIDIRLLAKALTKSGTRAPIVAIEATPVQVKLVLVDPFTGEA